MSRFALPWRRLRSVIAVLLLAAAFSWAASATAVILPLGDSITHGGTGDGGVLYPTYRAWLYQDLEKLGYDVDFVGSLHTPEPPSGSDPDNEGHAAYTAGQVLAELPSWLEAYPAPDVALVHLGTNDALADISAARTTADLQGIVGVLRARNPSMTILVAQIIPTSVESINARIEALNREIGGLATLSTPQSPVVIVDLYSGYDGREDNQQGGVHPLTSGEKKMAAGWEMALVPILAGGVGTDPAIAPTIVPAVYPVAPVSGPAVTTTVPAADPTVTVVATPTAVSRFGSRTYRIGSNPGQSRPGGAGPGMTVARASRSRVAASNDATAITPPTKTFTRWYPATRWAVGLR
jgi:lysophospholipase L1-like esterase